MSTLNSISVVGGIIFLAYVIISSTYWADAARWADKIKTLLEGDEKERARKNRKRAEKLFNLCTGTAVFTIILTVIPVYFQNEIVATVCKWLLLIPLIAIIALCIQYATGRYFVDID